MLTRIVFKCMNFWRLWIGPLRRWVALVIALQIIWCKGAECQLWVTYFWKLRKCHLRGFWQEFSCRGRVFSSIASVIEAVMGFTFLKGAVSLSVCQITGTYEVTADCMVALKMKGCTLWELIRFLTAQNHDAISWIVACYQPESLWLYCNGCLQIGSI